MAKIKYSRLLVIAVVLLALVLTSCKSEVKSSDLGPSGPKAVLDEKLKVEKTISAMNGGDVSLTSAEGVKVDISFAQQSLAKDTSVVVAPLSTAPLDGKDILVKGFSLEEKGKEGKGLKLAMPARISFTVKGQLPEGTSIIKYKDDGKNYEVVPTTIKTAGDSSILMAEAMSFSKYGGKNVGKKAADDAKKKKKGLTWHIYIKDKQKMVARDGTNVTLEIDLKTVNTSGEMSGKYEGTISIKDTGIKQTGSIPVAAIIDGKDDKLSFNLDPLFDLAPLVPPTSDPKPVPLNGEPPLVPLVKADHTGSGTMHLSTDIKTMVGEATPNMTLDLPFDITAYGPAAVLTLKIPGQSILFRGYIRGEGKK